MPGLDNAVFVRVVDVPEAGTLFQRYFVKGSNTQWSDSLDGIEPLVRLMPVVLVLKFKSPPYLRSFRPMTTGKELAVGDQVCVDATPLSNICPDIFIHSTIYGHICGCYGNSNALFIVDAPCPVGCEGGAVLLLRGWTTEKPHPLFSLAGMVVCPVLLKDGALSGIGLAITMEHIAKSLEKEMGISLVNTPYPKSLAFNPKQRMSVEEFSLFVCGVVAGATWGTGIILSPNLILTCSHVVEGMSSVVIVQENGRHQRASVVYSTKPSCAMDVAVISASQSLRCVDKVKWRGSSCLKGDRVAIVGCGLHNPLTKANAGPLVTFGHISNILYQEDNPVMYHTTAPAIPGCSGGAVVSMETGKLVGMVTSIVSDKTSKQQCPMLNFVLPFSLLEDPLTEYMYSGDTSKLFTMDTIGEDPLIKNFWRLSMQSREGTQLNSKL